MLIHILRVTYRGTPVNSAIKRNPFFLIGFLFYLQ